VERKQDHPCQRRGNPGEKGELERKEKGAKFEILPAKKDEEHFDTRQKIPRIQKREDVSGNPISRRKEETKKNAP